MFGSGRAVVARRPCSTHTHAYTHKAYRLTGWSGLSLLYVVYLFLDKRLAAYPQGAFYTTVRQDIAGSSRSRGKTRATLQGCQVRSRDWETEAERRGHQRCRLSRSTSTSASTKHQHRFKKAVAKTVSGWISPGCRGLDSFIGKVVGPRDARLGKGGSQTRAKVKTAQALGTWGTDCQIARLLPWPTGELYRGTLTILRLGPRQK